MIRILGECQKAAKAKAGGGDRETGEELGTSKSLLKHLQGYMAVVRGVDH